MSTFELYFQLGLQHILDIEGMDHILFVIALCALYQWSDWKKIIVLVTAFTLGHSLTLALATLQWIQVNSDWVETLIPLTILITGINNLRKPMPARTGVESNYYFAVFFGLIHGLGFSNYLRSLLGQEASLWQPLLAFNLGLEVGQLAIVLGFLILASLLIGALRIKRREWTLSVSSFTMGMALYILLNQIL
jgi:hypothetical protein